MDVFMRVCTHVYMYLQIDRWMDDTNASVRQHPITKLPMCLFQTQRFSSYLISMRKRVTLSPPLTPSSSLYL